MANLMDDYSRLVEVLQVDAIEYDQPDPYARLVWRDGHWTSDERADYATTTQITLRGRSTDRWYRRYPYGFRTARPRWCSLAGGTPAPGIVVRALDAIEALRPR